MSSINSYEMSILSYDYCGYGVYYREDIKKIHYIHSFEYMKILIRKVATLLSKSIDCPVDVFVLIIEYTDDTYIKKIINGNEIIKINRVCFYFNHDKRKNNRDSEFIEKVIYSVNQEYLFTSLKKEQIILSHGYVDNQLIEKRIMSKNIHCLFFILININSKIYTMECVADLTILLNEITSYPTDILSVIAEYAQDEYIWIVRNYHDQVIGLYTYHPKTVDTTHATKFKISMTDYPNDQKVPDRLTISLYDCGARCIFLIDGTYEKTIVYDMPDTYQIQGTYTINTTHFPFNHYRWSFSRLSDIWENVMEHKLNIG